MRDIFHISSKRAGLGAILLGTVVLGGSLVAEAQDYPPLAPEVAVDDPTPPPAGPVVATVTGCIPGETVNFSLLASTATDVCQAVAGAAFFVQAAATGGIAVGELEAPGAPGTYTGTADLLQSEISLSFSVVVEADTGGPLTPTTTIAGVLPRTGSESNGLTSVAIGLVVAGAGLFGVSQLRRRRLTPQ